MSVKVYMRERNNKTLPYLKSLVSLTAQNLLLYHPLTYHLEMFDMTPYKYCEARPPQALVGFPMTKSQRL